jgi:hypothetical protein
MPDMTVQPPQKDPILTRLRAELDEIYGPRVERVVFVRFTRARRCAAGFRL